ncbi:MAG: glutamyl-tRNA reductase [Planctomycetaceae bacterium]|nr:glutamyl-tRNA reductase [Planctomycetaceae bacterium]
MNVQVVYCNHQTADLSVREKLAFASEAELLRAYDALRARFPASEHVVVSTCNRVELYTAQEAAGDAPSTRELAQFFSEFHDLPIEAFLGDLLARTGTEAVRHLFDVACSIDSMVLGESQIVSQVKSAYDIATKGNANGPLTNALFQRALTVSRRVRTETRLSEGRISIASVAVGEFGRNIFDRFDDKTILVIGAGEMAEETLRYLQNEGVGRIVVVYRTPENSQRLVHEFGGQAQPWADLDMWLGRANIIISTTGADRPIVDAERFRKVRRRGAGEPVFILDLGAPRDFDPAVAEVDEGVFLYDIDDLERTCAQNRAARTTEIARARDIVEEETARFMHDVYHKATGPIIQRLRERWHDVSRQELELLFRKLPDLDSNDQQAIERTVERIVNKLLHPPLETLRDEARDGTPHGLLDAVRRLFHLH